MTSDIGTKNYKNVRNLVAATVVRSPDLLEIKKFKENFLESGMPIILAESKDPQRKT